MNTVFILLCCTSLGLSLNPAFDNVESLVRSSNHKDVEVMLKTLEGYKTKIIGPTLEGKSGGCSTDGCLDDTGCENVFCPECSWFICDPRKMENDATMKLQTINDMKEVVGSDGDLLSVILDIEDTVKHDTAVERLHAAIEASNNKDENIMLKALEGYMNKIKGKTAGCSTDGCIDDSGCKNDACPECSWMFICNNKKENTEETVMKKMETLDALEKIVEDDESLLSVVKDMKNIVFDVTAVERLYEAIKASNNKDENIMLKAVEGYMNKIKGNTAGCSTDGCISDSGCQNDSCPECSWMFICNNKKENTEEIVMKKIETLDALEKIAEDDESLLSVVKNMKNIVFSN